MNTGMKMEVRNKVYNTRYMTREARKKEYGKEYRRMKNWMQRLRLEWMQARETNRHIDT